jgi:hypothetical protein
MALAGWAFGLLVACEERPAGPADTGVPPPPPPPVERRPGCSRNGPLDGIDTDAACIVKQVPEDAMRASMKRLSITVTPEPTEVISGSSGVLAITIKNTSNIETTVYFEARQRLAGPRTDWTRVAGVPDVHPNAGENAKLLFPLTTTDNYDRDVDALPTVANSTPPASPPTILAVHLRPGAKVHHSVMWWALRIPAPAPIVTDDAGHRYIPKTIASPLFPADYNVAIDLPLYGLTREERKLTIKMKVIRAPLFDGGPRPF